MSVKGQGVGYAWLLAHVPYEGDECLIWPFSHNGKGYGQISYLGKVYKAHRLMCILAHGEPPTPEHHAAHSCGKGHLRCVHPQHVSWKTPSENRLDSNEHGTGKIPKPRKLTLDQVEQIRGSDKTQKELAGDFGVHPETIGRIVRGEFWTDPRSTLTLEQIRIIREAPEADCLKIGRSLGVDSTKVRKLRGGISFQGIE